MARHVQVKRAVRADATEAKGAKAEGAKAKSANLEVLGLVLLALGVLLLGLLLPLPLGELGALMRDLFVGRIGTGAYLLPWPPLVLGGLFLLGRNPPGWPRWLLAYAVTGFGVWLLVSLLAPALGGAWGRLLHSSVGGATGVLASALALLIILIGIDISLKLAPTTLLRRGFQRGAQGAQRAFHGGASARRKVKARAAFNADVALAKKRLRGLSGNLSALGELYPGSAELGRWQEMVGNARGNLRWADPDILADTQTDAAAWEEAVGGFTRARAAELAAQVEGEGLPSFVAQQDRLFGPLTEPLPDRALDGVRKLLVLEHTALGERYSRLLRDRDHAVEALSDTTPKQLVRATQAHADRTDEFAEVEAAQAALSADTELLGPWTALLERVAELRSAYSKETALETFDAELHARLKKGRGSLSELEAQTENLDALETTLNLVTAEPAPEPVFESDDSNDGDDHDEPEAEAEPDAPWDDAEPEAAPPDNSADDSVLLETETRAGTRTHPRSRRYSDPATAFGAARRPSAHRRRPRSAAPRSRGAHHQDRRDVSQFPFARARGGVGTRPRPSPASRSNRPPAKRSAAFRVCPTTWRWRWRSVRCESKRRFPAKA